MSFYNNKAGFDGNDGRIDVKENKEENLQPNKLIEDQVKFQANGGLTIQKRPENQVDESMLMQDEKERQMNRKEKKLSKNDSSKKIQYEKYEKSVKKQGVSSQMRVKSKLNFILSRFMEEDSVGSVSYYNESPRSKSSSSSESIHSNEMRPIQYSKQQLNQQIAVERGQKIQKFEELPLVKSEQKKQTRKYVFYQQKTLTQTEKLQKHEEQRKKIPTNSHQIKQMRREEQKIFVEESEQVNRSNQSHYLNQKQEKERKFLQGQKQQEHASSLNSAKLDNVLRNRREQLAQKGVSKSVSINKQSSHTSKLSNPSKNNRYNRQEENQKESSKQISSIQLIEPKMLYLSQKKSQKIEKTFPNSSKNKIEIARKSNQEEKSVLQTIKLSNAKKSLCSSISNDSLNNNPLKKNFQQNSEKQRVVTLLSENPIQREAKYLKTVQDTEIEALNQFLPKNVVSFHVEPKRKIKSELSERPEERTKMLALLKKREQALAKKVREQLKISPKIFRFGSGQSNYSSVNSNEYEYYQNQRNNSLINNGKFTLNSNVDHFRGTEIQKHHFYTPSGKPHFPTENLKYSKRQVNDPPPEFQTSEGHFPKLVHQWSKGKNKINKDLSEAEQQKKRSKERDPLDKLEKERESKTSKIVYYNLNRFHREHQVISNKNTSAKQKYERLKRLISQI